MPKFDLKSLEKLLYDFYNLTNIKICLYDSEGNELCYYPAKLNEFCKVIRENEKTDVRCRECDRHAFAICRKTRSQYVYVCHAGLKECVSPVICDNHIIGFIMLGQIKNNCEPNYFDFENELSENQIQRLHTAYDKLPDISEEKLCSAFHILDACAGYEFLKTLLDGYGNSIDVKIDKYINEHISKPLSVTQMCLEFHLSRYEIYNIFNEYFDCTPAEHIKKCRLNLACKFLADTNIPVNKIAERCGIPDYNYFSKVFKTACGISPTEYRKERKSKKSID